ncbi:MAG: hypothetical protein WAL80_21655 [Xanthobacteraceae bacterium]
MSRKKRNIRKRTGQAGRQYDEDIAGSVRHKPKKSLGVLRKATKTKPLSPDVTGKLALQRHTFREIAKHFAETDDSHVICNIAAWRNQDQHGPNLTVEISPLFVRHERRSPQRSVFDFMGDDEDE